MSKYGAHLSNYSTSTSVKTALMLWALSNRRAEAVELIMTGSGAAAVADIPHQASAAFASTTVTGVGTTITPEKFPQGAPAAGSCITSAFTQEPTAYGTVFPVFFGFNTRGGQRWAVPTGEGVKVDSGVTNNRLGWRALGQASGNIDASLQFIED